MATSHPLPPPAGDALADALAGPSSPRVLRLPDLEESPYNVITQIVVQGATAEQRRAQRRLQRHSRRRAQLAEQNEPLETVPEFVDPADYDLQDPADEVEERDYFPPPETGPHALIGHAPFRYFWGVFFSRAEYVKTSYFCASLLRYLAMPAPAPPADGSAPGLPFPPCGYGLSESEIVHLDRGSPRSIMDGLVLAIDLDESGRVQASMLGCALLGLPRNTSLREAVYLLAAQRGKVVLPPPYVASPAYVRGLVQSCQAVPAGQGKCEDLFSPFALHGEEEEVFGARGYERYEGEALQERIEGCMRVPGWSLIGGAAGMGRTARSVAACRAVLNSIRMQDPYATPSVAASVSVSSALLDPLSLSPSTVHSIAQLGALHRLDALYLDFRAAASRAEVLTAMAAQLGFSGGTRNQRDAELQLHKLLALLKPGSILLLDHVSADCCAALTALFDPFAARLAIVVISGPQQSAAGRTASGREEEEDGEGDDEREGGGVDAALSELMDELGARLASPHQGSVSVVLPLCINDALKLAARFWRARGEEGAPPLLLLETAAQLSGGCPGLLRLLLSVPSLDLLPSLAVKHLLVADAPPAALSPAKVRGPFASPSKGRAHRPASRTLTAQDVFYHPSVLAPDDLLALLALWPLRSSQQQAGAQRLPFDADLAWHLCREGFEATQMPGCDTRDRFHASLDRLLAVGWLEPAGQGLVAVSSLAHTCPLPAAYLGAVESPPRASPYSRAVTGLAVNLGLARDGASPASSPSDLGSPAPTVAQRRQWDVYFAYWAGCAVRLGEALGGLADQEDCQGPLQLVDEPDIGARASRHLVSSALDAQFPHLFRLFSLWLSDGSDAPGAKTGAPEQILPEASVDSTRVDADRTVGAAGETADLATLNPGLLGSASDTVDLSDAPATPIKGFRSPLMAVRSTSDDAIEALSPGRASASLHLSVLGASRDFLDSDEGGALARTRSIDRLERERDVRQLREQEREVRRRRRAELRRRHASDEKEVVQPSNSQALALALAGNVGQLCASRLSVPQTVELTRSLVLAAHNADAQFSQQSRAPPGHRGSATLEAYIEFGCALLRSGGAADLDEARRILKDATAMAEAQEPLGPGAAGRTLLQALFHYGRALLNLPPDALDYDHTRGAAAYGDETSAAELGTLVLEQVPSYSHMYLSFFCSPISVTPS